MSKGIIRRVHPMSDGVWMNKRDDSDRSSTTHDNLEEAQRTARRMLREEGGGEVITVGRDGKVICMDVVPPAV